MAEVTDDKKLPKRVRKQLQIEHAADSSPRAKQLRIADKICNIRDVMVPPEDWSLSRRLKYLDWCEQVAAGCRGVNPKLDAVFGETLARARRVLAEAVLSLASPGHAGGWPGCLGHAASGPIR